MKRTTLLKLAFVITAMFTFAEMNAQILTNYAETNATAMYQTAGRTFRLYVMPDPVYSPSYDAATNANLGANSQWTFTFAAGLGTGTPLTGVASANNFVEFVNPTTVGSPFTVTAVESNTLVGCADASAENQIINIVAAPTATVTTADNLTFCGDQLAQSVVLTFVENVPNANAAFGFAVSELVEEIDGIGGFIATVGVPDATFVDFPLATKAKFPANLGGGTPTFTHTFNTSVLTVSNNNRTRYTYTLTKASDAPGALAQGIVSAISQKSDYEYGTPKGNVNGVISYAFTDNSVVFIVNPTPVTGPIYHVSNTFNY